MNICELQPLDYLKKKNSSEVGEKTCTNTLSFLTLVPQAIFIYTPSVHKYMSYFLKCTLFT